MATLNITTNKTRAQMVTELTNWADATKVSGSDYVWACADDINVTAEIELYGFTLTFTTGKRIYASAGGNIKVSMNFLHDFNLPSTICIKGIKRQQINFISGTGKWTGRGLNIKTDKAWPCFNSGTSQTNLTYVSIDAITEDETYTHFLLHVNGTIILSRLTGIGFQFGIGHYGTSENSNGLVSGNVYGKVILWVNTNSLSSPLDLNGLTVNYDSANKFSNHYHNIISFIDSNVDPDNMLCGPINNANVVRNVKRTMKLMPSATNGDSISGFKYRLSSNRIANPGDVVTNNHTIATNLSGDFNDTYLFTVWHGSTAIGSGTYGTLRDTLNDKDLRIQFRKYRYKEGEFKSNSYYYAQNATSTLEVDTFTKEDRTRAGDLANASEFYDTIRRLISLDMELPDDLFTSDGVTIAIKPTWTLKRSSTELNIAIDKTNKFITLDLNSYIAQYRSGKWNFTSFTGTVDSSMTGHTNMIFARADGKANLVLNITCPAGSKDPVVAIWPFSQGLDNRANLITGHTTGTGVRNVTLLVDATVKYYCIAKALGANLYRPFSIEPVGGLGGSKDITLFVYEKTDGTPLFPDTLTPAQTAIADTLEFHSTHIDVKIPTDFASNPRWSATDKIWQYTVDDFIAIAYKLDVIQTALTLSVARNQLIFMEEGRLLISAAADDKILEQDPANKTTVSSTTNVKVSFTTISIARIGDTDARNTFIDDINGTIDVRGGVPINGGFSIADANRLVVVETKANETHQRLALDSTKPLTSKPDGGITSTGIAITATELADGSVVQTRGT